MPPSPRVIHRTFFQLHVDLESFVFSRTDLYDEHFTQIWYNLLWYRLFFLQFDTGDPSVSQNYVPICDWGKKLISCWDERYTSYLSSPLCHLRPPTKFTDNVIRSVLCYRPPLIKVLYNRLSWYTGPPTRPSYNLFNFVLETSFYFLRQNLKPKRSTISTHIYNERGDYGKDLQIWSLLKSPGKSSSGYSLIYSCHGPCPCSESFAMDDNGG